MLTDDEIIAQVFQAFQEEQHEHRQAIGELVLTLERTPEHPQRRELLDQLFREAHSLKGGARAAGQEAIEAVAHCVEDLFSAVRTGALALTPDVCDPVYAALDAIGALMEQASAGATPTTEPYAPLLAALAALVASADVPSAAGPLAPAAAPALPPPAAQPAPAEPAEASWESGATTVRLATTTLDSLLNETGELVTCAVRARVRSHEARDLAALPDRWRRTWRQIRPALARLESRAPSLRPTVHYLDDRPIDPAHAGAAHRASGSPALWTEGDIGALVEALGQANALIAELERGLVQQAHRIGEDHARLSAVTDRLHDQIRRTRMLPLSTIIGPLRLQVRDMARAAKRQVLLSLDDGDAEADRQVLDALRDVLLHLLRNAIDHGIEPPAERAAAGKQAEGCITLRAAVSGDRLTLTVEDDGAGLDLGAIRGRALAGGVMSEADLARLSQDELQDLIFLPGFSTRRIVSALSGRGVGLDIVRSRVERMHGRVTVHSTPGAGCRFTLTVPLSLTSSHGLLLRAGAGSYVIPLEAVQRIVPVAPRDVQLIEGRAAIRVDSRPVALVRLAELLGLSERRAQTGGAKDAPARASGDQQMALLLGSGDRTIAFLVDAVLSEQELVVYRLPAPLQRVRFIAGATIMADGGVIPLLDVVDLLRSATSARHTIVAPEPHEPERRTPTILVVDDSITTRTLEKNILESAGYRVRLATDGHEAMQLLREMADDGGCDLLLSDVDMPRMSGFDLAAQVRADARLQHTPVVLVTSLDTPADRERGVAAGADAYIVKRAFDQQTLLETIAGLI